MQQKSGIQAQWSIDQSGTRTAKVGPYTLVAVPGHPARWAVIQTSDLDRVVMPEVQGKVFQGTRYGATIRQAMFNAEQAAAALLVTA